MQLRLYSVKLWDNREYWIGKVLKGIKENQYTRVGTLIMATLL
jgi:hypothetical protein